MSENYASGLMANAAPAGGGSDTVIEANESEGLLSIGGSSHDGPVATRAPEALSYDPGASVLVTALVEAIGTATNAASPSIITLQGLKNQSRTPPAEVEDLRRRLLALLGPASNGRGVRFVDENEQESEYTLSGTVYLVQRDGFDQWELYLSLRPRDANWTIWRNDQPVRLLRQVRVDGDAILYARQRED